MRLVAHGVIAFVCFVGSASCHAGRAITIDDGDQRHHAARGTAVYEEDDHYVYAAIVCGGMRSSLLSLDRGSSYVVLLRIPRVESSPGYGPTSGVTGYLFKQSVVLVFAEPVDSAEVRWTTTRTDRGVLDGTIRVSRTSEDGRGERWLTIGLENVVLQKDPETLRRAFLEHYARFEKELGKWLSSSIPTP